MTKHSIFLRPVDPVWFRSGRPLVAGESTGDAAVFPPTPWTFQGMVRTRLLTARFPGQDVDAKSGAEIQAAVGPPGALPEGWRLEGPFPARVAPGGAGAHGQGGGELEPWFPAPRMLLEGARGPLRPRPLRRDQSFLSSSPLTTLLAAERPGEGGAPLSGWISWANLCWALTGRGRWDSRGHTTGRHPPFVRSEPRPGLQVDSDKGSAEDHMLYVADYARFEHGAGLWGRLEATLEPAMAAGIREGAGSVGRKGRLVAFEDAPTSPPDLEELLSGAHLEKTPLPDGALLWVCLLTPAFHDEGSGLVPYEVGAPGADRHTWTLGNARLRLVGALAGAGREVGGFDLQARRGKAAKATWAAGSSWLFEIKGRTETDRRSAARALAGTAPSKLERFGFGQRVVGVFDPQTFEPIPRPKAEPTGGGHAER